MAVLSTKKIDRLRIGLFHLVGFHLGPVGPDSSVLSTEKSCRITTGFLGQELFLDLCKLGADQVGRPWMEK